MIFTFERRLDANYRRFKTAMAKTQEECQAALEELRNLALAYDSKGKPVGGCNGGQKARATKDSSKGEGL